MGNDGSGQRPGASMPIGASSVRVRRERYRRLARRPSRGHAQPQPTVPKGKQSQHTEPAVTEPIPPPDGLAIRCFGRFEVWRNGAPVQRWRRRAAGTLLKYLVAQRSPIHRDVLLDLLWPELPPGAGLNDLRVTLHSLRQTLGPSPSEVSSPIMNLGAVYYLNPAAAIWIDADVFSAHFEAGLKMERRLGLARASIEYAAAEALYRDDFLIEDLYEEWTVLRREELRDQYLLVLTKMAQHCLTSGDAEGCIVRCHKLLNKEPCNEDAYQRLMRAYVHLGQHDRAAHWYAICERTLRRELDLAPSNDTRMLLRNIGRHHHGAESDQ